MTVGWRDNKGRFHPIPGARAGQDKSVWTGAGDCIVKMIDENDPRHAPAAPPPKVDHKPGASKCPAGLLVTCDCGWETIIPDYAFTTSAKMEAEAKKRFSKHFREARA